LGLNATQIQSLLDYVDDQMKATDGSGGLPAGFPRDLGDINGDGTGDGDSSGLPAAMMNGSVVKVGHPTVRQLAPHTGGDPWAWQEQERVEVFTHNARGQLTTHTDAEGNVTATIRYPENDPDGNGQITIPFLSNKQYGQIKEIHQDVDPNRVMSLIGEDGDLTDFESVIERTNTPGVYQNLVTRYEGAPGGSGGCSTCAYDPLGNPLAVTDPRGFTTVFARNEMGVEYRRTSPAPYLNQVEKYFDANGNVVREDTQDQQVTFLSDDPTDAGYAKFFPSGNAEAGPANVPLQAGEGGEIRPGWFTNLYSYDLLDNKTEEDLDATGSQPASLVTRFAYDANENLTQITKPQGNTVEYDYDERNLRIAQRIGYVETDEYPPAVPGAVSVWVYDGNGNLIQAIGPAQRGASGNSLTVTLNDAFGSGQALIQTGDYATENIYDGFDRVIETIDAVGNVSRWDGTAEAPALDPAGRQILTMQQGPAGGATPSNRSGADNVDLAVSIARFDEGGRSYEQQQTVLLATGKSGGSPTHTLPSSRAVTHTGGGLEANSTTNGHTATATLTSGDESYVLTRIVYDRSNRTVAIAQDNGAIATNAYDGADRLITQTDALGNVTENSYDGNDNLILSAQTQKATITAPAIADEIFRTANRYDCMNRLVLSATQGANGDLTTNLNACCTWPVQSTSPTTLLGYDSRGNKTVAIDPNGNTSITLYDGASRAIETVQHLRQDGQGDAAPQSGRSFLPSGGSVIRTQMRYDGNGNTVQIVDDRGGATTYTYDEQDRLIETIQHDGSTSTNVYNEAGNVIQLTDDNGSVFSNTFDPLGRKTAVSISRASGIGGTTSQSFQYDGLSRQTFARDMSGSNADANLYFDSLSRVVEENQNGHYVTQSAFTSQAATELTYPNDRQVTSGYDALYRRNQVTETSTSDSIAQWNFVGQRAVEVLLGNGLIQTMLNNNRAHSMVQTTVPNPAWGNASSDRLGYDGSSRMIAKRYLTGGIDGTTHTYNDTAPVVGFTTQYDLSGNKMFERELHAETRSHLYQPFDESGVPLGGYDSVDRLRKALRGELSSDSGYTATGGGSITTPLSLPNTDTSRTYDLDGLGNWKESDYIPVGGTATIDLRQHNKLNEITSRKVGGGVKVLFAYDGTSGASNGNLADDGTLELSYDALNRLIQVKRKSDGATIGQYVYDALNRRVSKTISNGGLTGDIPDGSTTFLYQNWQAVEELDGSSATTKQYVWGQYIDECIQLKTLATSGAGDLPAGEYYPLQDLLYRTIALTDGEGSIAEAYDYDAYGNTLIFSAAGTGDNWWANDATQANYAACEVLFCGYRYDPESKLYQVRNRDYYPALGRWLQRDPIGFDGGDWNLYGYVSGNPAKRIDSTGEQDVIIIIGIIIVAGAIILLFRGCHHQAPPPIPDPCNNPQLESLDGCQDVCNAIRGGGGLSDYDVLTCCGSLLGPVGGTIGSPDVPGTPLGGSGSTTFQQVQCRNALCSRVPGGCTGTGGFIGGG
jgi:RHS repeat-associated protein